jgi:flagellar FliJ protein
MSLRFRFRLQRLLDLRERKEQDAAVALAAAQRRADELQAQCDATTTRRSEARARMLPPGGAAHSMRDLYTAALLVEQLDGAAMSLAESLRVAAGDADSCRGSLAERVRERRTLERLRDRKLEEWNSASAQRDRETMDSVAQSRAASMFVTSNKAL